MNDAPAKVLAIVPSSSDGQRAIVEMYFGAQAKQISINETLWNTDYVLSSFRDAPKSPHNEKHLVKLLRLFMKHHHVSKKDILAALNDI
jgi:hypothetical protein